MAYAKELDELRKEVRKSVATTLSVWPKVAGTGNVATTGTPTFEVYDPDGTLVQSSTSCTATSVGSITRLDCAVSAITTLGEDYQLRVTWIANGESLARLDIAFFDVVLWPFGQPSVSLNDLLELRPEIGDVLSRHATLLSSTSEALAATHAVRARAELDQMLRNQVTSDGQTRPHLVLSRDRLIPVERYLALASVYEADANNPAEGVDESSALYRHYRAESDRAWRQMGPLKYETEGAEDLVPDAVATAIGRSIRLRRVQG